MTDVPRVRLLLACLSLALAGPALADEPGPESLPAGALARLGQVRTRAELRITTVAFSPDGKTVAGGNWANMVRLWDIASGKEIATFQGEHSGMPSVTFSPVGKLLATASGNGSITLWDSDTGKYVRTLDKHRGLVTSLRFSPDGKWLASAGFDYTVRLWEVATGQELRRFEGHWEAVHSVAFSPDGRTLASGGDDETVRLWDVVTGRELASFSGHHGAVRCVAFSPDGKSLASGGKDQLICLLESASAKERQRFEGHRGSIQSLAFSPDGKSISSAGEDQVIHLWEATSGKERGRLQGHRGVIWSVAFSPDGRSLASGSSDATIFLWRVTSINPQRVPGKLEPEQLESLWADLAGTDAGKAYQAIQALTASPEQTTAWMREHLRPAEGIDRQLTRMIADLDSDRFEVREKATQELEQLGELAETQLRKTLRNKPSLEVQQRIDKLLGKFTVNAPLPSDILRGVRSIEVLQALETPQAREILEMLANGAPQARLTREARTAWEQVAKRRSGRQ